MTNESLSKSDAKNMSDVPTTPESGQTSSRPGSRRRVRMVLTCAGLAALAWAGYRYWHGQTHVSTDNAQVAGRVIPLLAKVGGFVAAVSVQENQRVGAGTPLVMLDDRDYRARLTQAEAELQMAVAAAGKEGFSGQAEAQLAAARANAGAARSNIDQSLANADKAQKDLERIRTLVAKKMSSPQALDAAEAAARAAAAQVRAARETATSAGEQITASSAALRAALAKVQAAGAARDLAAIQLAETHVAAPANGVIGSRTAEPGQLVQAGQPLLTLVTDEIWVNANLKETDVAEVKTGQAARLEIDAYPGIVFKGHVESISPASGAVFSLLPPDNATGNFTKVVQRIPVRIHVDEADPARPLRPGMSAVVTITTR